MKRHRHSGGFAAIPVVTGIALLMTLSLTMLFRYALMSREQAAQAQLKVDYHQREEALLRALVAIFPAKAVACMKANHEADGNHAWSRIFAEAVTLSSVSQGLSPELAASLGLANARSADVGSHSSDQVESWITSLSGVSGQVTPGTTAYAQVFSQAAFAGRMPPLLDADAALQSADALRPVVTPLKRYSTQDPGLLADVSAYPVYNLIPYPNIRFGYAAPGQPFVAKRNWWAFTVNYGNSGRSVAKHYVLSLYEIPSQMPIEASAFAAIGRHEDGTAWSSSQIRIDGSVYAGQLAVEGAFGAARLAGRSGISITDTVNLGGISVDSNFDALGVREQLQATEGSDFLPVALSANSGRLAFQPLQPGPAFLLRPAPGATLNAWDRYTLGSEQCRVTVEALSMVSYENQTPVAVRVRFRTPSGGTGETQLQRGVNWPTVYEPGGDLIPFQTELTNNGRSCITFQPAQLNNWLLGLGGASVTENHSIHFGVAAGDATVRALSAPPAAEDMCVIIRRGKDLTSFTRGLSIVAPLRVYVGDDLNNIAAAAPPSGSGLPLSAEFYPPMSIFSAELRIGTTAFNRPVEHFGQLGTLASGGATSWKPLDIKSGSDDAVHSDTIAAELSPLRSPAELPPIHQMNWLVVIEEVSRD